MSAENRPVRLRLLDMLDMIALSEAMLEGVDLETYQMDRKLQLAVERSLEIISEASRHIPETMKTRFDLPWRRIANLGNITRHGYADVDQVLIYGTVREDLTALKTACEVLYAEVKRPSDPWPDASGK